MQGYYPTTDGDLAAILMALGCEPVRGDEVTNVYTEEKPYRPNTPGNVTWNVNPKSAFPDVKAGTIAKGYDDNGAIAEELDALIAKVKDSDVRAAIQRLLPQVIASFSRAAFTNRRKIARWWQDCPEYLLIKRGRKTYLINRNAEKLRKKWNL